MAEDTTETAAGALAAGLKEDYFALVRPMAAAWDVLLESLFEVRYTINSTVNEAWAWRDSGHAGLTDPAAYIKALGAAQAARTAAEKALAAVRDLAAEACGDED